MEITLLQGILLTIMTIIVGLDFFLEAFFIFRPLIVSTLTGLILGDITLGLKVGALIELAFAGLTPAGGTQPPNPVFACLLYTSDPEIPYHYNKVNVKKAKGLNKEALQKELGLNVDQNVLLIGVVSRLTWQKGFYLMMEKLSEICAMPIQLAVLGSGEASIEEKMAQLEAGNKGKIAFYKGYNLSLIHIYSKRTIAVS